VAGAAAHGFGASTTLGPAVFRPTCPRLLLLAVGLAWETRLIAGH
jgi:hypothetical protein